MNASQLPGTTEHQRLLRAIAAQYAHDDRVLAVVVFGSLGRGSWDQYSDLDLDVVIVDGVTLDAVEEARQLFAALGEPMATLVPDGDDAVDVMLVSLMMVSIRYHPLGSTSPNIVDSLVVLSGRLGHEEVVAAGLANRQERSVEPADLLAACVRSAVIVDVCLHRRQVWVGYLVLHQAREQLLRLFAVAHGMVRPYHGFEAAADASLRASLGRTVSEARLPALQRALLSLLDVLEHDLEGLSAGMAQLTEAQRQVVTELRARQAQLDLTGE